MKMIWCLSPCSATGRPWTLTSADGNCECSRLPNGHASANNLNLPPYSAMFLLAHNLWTLQNRETTEQRTSGKFTE